MGLFENLIFFKLRYSISILKFIAYYFFLAKIKKKIPEKFKFYCKSNYIF